MSLHHSHQGCGCGCGHHGPAQAGPAPSQNWAQAADDEMVCYCQGLTKGSLREAIGQGAYTLALLKTVTGAGRGRQCKQRHPQGRTCEPDLEELIRLYAEPPAGLFSAGSCGA